MKVLLSKDQALLSSRRVTEFVSYGTLLSQLDVSSNPIHVYFLLLPTFRVSGACYTGLIWLVSIVWGVGQAHIDHGEESELVTTSLPDTPGSSRVLSRSALDHGEF